MKLLLTSSGIKNKSIQDALIELLGKPIEESSALIIPTAIYPFPGGGRMAMRAVTGTMGGPLAGLPWKSIGILELTALPSIDRDAWVPTVHETDAILVFGGDVLYLIHWMRESGFAELLRDYPGVYVGVSAGSMAATAKFGETYVDPPRGSHAALTSEEVVFQTPDGPLPRIVVSADGIGLVDFAIIPHFEHPDHTDASTTNAEIWASRLPVPTYAIDENTAIKVVDGQVEVISEGNWKLFNS
jgi:dipeptidase E